MTGPVNGPTAKMRLEHKSAALEADTFTAKPLQRFCRGKQEWIPLSVALQADALPLGHRGGCPAYEYPVDILNPDMRWRWRWLLWSPHHWHSAVVCWLLNVPATCWSISGTDLLSLDNCTCCHTETEVAYQTFHPTQSRSTDTRPTSPSADPITPSAWRCNHWNANY